MGTSEQGAVQTQMSRTEAAEDLGSIQGKVIAHDETDGRRRYEWASRYPGAVAAEIWLEAFYVGLVLVCALVGIYATWYGYISRALVCEGCSTTTLNRYAYFFFSGMLGSVLFGGKYLYHVVARGYWHQDRKLWRILSPILSASLAFVVAAVVQSGMLGLTFRAEASASCIALGFLSGYFADKALAKMTEIADVVFGTRESKGKSHSGSVSSDQTARQ